MLRALRTVQDQRVVTIHACKCGHDQTSHYADSYRVGSGPLIQTRLACLCRGCSCERYVELT
jgi:hypothetical protein